MAIRLASAFNAWMISKSYYLGRLLFFLFILTTTVSEANTEQSALLGLIQELHCTQSEPQASLLLKKLSELPLNPFGIPSENLNGQDAELYAATVDILLKVFYETLHRFPKLQENIERIALRWNYCETFNDGDFADLSASKGEIEKREAIGPFPAHKQGFGMWGFVRNVAGERYIPEILKYPALFPRAYQDLLQRLNQMQCFPNPDLEAPKNLNSNFPYSGSLQLSEPLASGKKYPYTWKEQCEPSPAENKKIERVATKPSISFIHYNQVKPVIKQETLVVEKTVEVPNKAIQVPVIHPQKPKHPTKKIVVAEKRKTTILGLEVKQYVQPSNDESPVLSPAVPSGNSNMGPALPLPPTGGLGIAGNFFHRAKLTGALSFGANASWKPMSYFFVRGGVNYNYLPDSGKFSYSWGLGYDDWHQGTFSVQLNNWGPLAPGDDPLKGAVANFGYKFVADFLKPYHLSGSAAVNVPLSGDPSISTTWIWSPIEHWFIRGSLSKSLVSAGGLDWSYSFGYSDWHPFTFSLTYDNWGTNPIFDSSQGNSFNFSENGAITLSWSWAF